MTSRLENVIRFLRNTDEKIRIMEICGTHTSAIHKNGIRSLISSDIELVSGPGCPVCVTPSSAIDDLISYSNKSDCTVLSFGDMFRVRGNNKINCTLSESKNVHMMYSPFEVLALANENKNRQFVIAAVGFETTIPIYAALLERIIEKDIKNVKLYTALKTMPEVLEYINDLENKSIDAFLCPGHVSVITGSKVYQSLCVKYKKPFVVAGFEAEHILTSIYEILYQKRNNIHKVTNLYKSVVSENGQINALNMIAKYFIKADSYWRGIGLIKNSGYVLRDEYKRFDAERTQCVLDYSLENKDCQCSDIILGRKTPLECPLFRKKCNPLEPIGACMVSTEGTCRIWLENYSK